MKIELNQLKEFIVMNRYNFVVLLLMGGLLYCKIYMGTVTEKLDRINKYQSWRDEVYLIAQVDDFNLRSWDAGNTWYVVEAYDLPEHNYNGLKIMGVADSVTCAKLKDKYYEHK